MGMFDDLLNNYVRVYGEAIHQLSGFANGTKNIGQNAKADLLQLFNAPNAHQVAQQIQQERASRQYRNPTERTLQEGLGEMVTTAPVTAIKALKAVQGAGMLARSGATIGNLGLQGSILGLLGGDPQQSLTSKAAWGAGSNVALGGLLHGIGFTANKAVGALTKADPARVQAINDLAAKVNQGSGVVAYKPGYGMLGGKTSLELAVNPNAGSVEMNKLAPVIQDIADQVKSGVKPDRYKTPNPTNNGQGLTVGQSIDQNFANTVSKLEDHADTLYGAVTKVANKFGINKIDSAPLVQKFQQALNDSPEYFERNPGLKAKVQEFIDKNQASVTKNVVPGNTQYVQGYGTYKLSPDQVVETNNPAFYSFNDSRDMMKSLGQIRRDMLGSRDLDGARFVGKLVDSVVDNQNNWIKGNGEVYKNAFGNDPYALLQKTLDNANGYFKSKVVPARDTQLIRTMADDMNSGENKFDVEKLVSKLVGKDALGQEDANRLTQLLPQYLSDNTKARIGHSVIQDALDASEKGLSNDPQAFLKVLQGRMTNLKGFIPQDVADRISAVQKLSDEIENVYGKGIGTAGHTGAQDADMLARVIPRVAGAVPGAIAGAAAGNATDSPYGGTAGAIVGSAGGAMLTTKMMRYLLTNPEATQFLLSNKDLKGAMPNLSTQVAQIRDAAERATSMNAPSLNGTPTSAIPNSNTPSNMSVAPVDISKGVDPFADNTSVATSVPGNGVADSSGANLTTQAIDVSQGNDPFAMDNSATPVQVASPASPNKIDPAAYSNLFTNPFTKKIANKVLDLSTKYQVDPTLAAMIINREGGVDLNGKAKVSGMGAIGLMQLTPPTASDRGVKDPRMLYNNDVNLDTGMKQLAYLKKQLGTDDPGQIAAAYNMGLGKFLSAKAKADADGEDWRNYIDQKETKPYVDYIEGNLQQ